MNEGAQGNRSKPAQTCVRTNDEPNPVFQSRSIV